MLPAMQFTAPMAPIVLSESSSPRMDWKHPCHPSETPARMAARTARVRKERGRGEEGVDWGAGADADAEGGRGGAAGK